MRTQSPELSIDPAAEAEIVALFVSNARKSRLTELSMSPKRRRQFLRELLSFKTFDSAKVFRVDRGSQSSAQIYELLRGLGASEKCYLLSEEVVSSDLGLKEAVERVVGMDVPALIYCVDAEVAYLEQESFQNRFILRS